MPTRILAAALAVICLAPPAWAYDKAALKLAIERGVAFLRRSQTETGMWHYNGNEEGMSALAALTLVECGVPLSDPGVRKAARYLRERAPTMTATYTIALTILFLDRLDEASDIPLIESLTVRLLAGQAADGGWSYTCPAVGDVEARRLMGRPQRPAIPKGDDRPRPEVKDLPREIQDQLDQIDRLWAAGGPQSGSDNSNTQFATLGLWVGHRYGLPVDKALARLETRFRQSQHGDGGWGYNGPISATNDSSPSMTCAGLIGLAAAFGLANEIALDREKKGDEAGAKRARAKADVGKDLQVGAGLLAVGSCIGQPFPLAQSKRQRGNGPAPYMPAGIVPGPGGVPAIVGARGNNLDYYFLWSLERVAMIYGLQTIGKKDWYSWGVEIALVNQENDGSWRDTYAEGGADTCFMLLFLTRSNLARDLTAALRNKVKDSVELRGRGEVAPSLVRPKPSGTAARRAEPPEPLVGSRLNAPDPAVPRRPRASEPKPDSEAGKLRAEILAAPPERQEVLIFRLKEAKGGANTQALAAVIPDLSGPLKTRARDALAERLTRMTANTLRDKLQDDDPEVRRAAALACAMRDERTFVPDLLPLLEDHEPLVARAAHAALKSLAGRDLGNTAEGSREERKAAVARWKEWGEKQKGK